jgi:hypothetical protein
MHGKASNRLREGRREQDPEAGGRQTGIPRIASRTGGRGGLRRDEVGDFASPNRRIRTSLGEFAVAGAKAFLHPSSDVPLVTYPTTQLP